MAGQTYRESGMGRAHRVTQHRAPTATRYRSTSWILRGIWLRRMCRFSLGRRIFTRNEKHILGKTIRSAVACPSACLVPMKIIQTRNLVVILQEGDASFRQIFLDGRPLPADPQPSWRGYSVGKWE